MKISKYVLSMCLSNQKIKNINFPECRKCVHYQPKNNYDGKCKLFGNKDLITGEINYDYVDFCRNDKEKCDIEGKYFQELETKRLILREVKNKIKNNIYFIGFFSFFLLECYMIYKTTNP